MNMKRRTNPNKMFDKYFVIVAAHIFVPTVKIGRDTCWEFDRKCYDLI